MTVQKVYKRPKGHLLQPLVMIEFQSRFVSHPPALVIGWRALTQPSRATRSRLPCWLRFDQRRGRRDQRREHRDQGWDPAGHKPRPQGGTCYRSHRARGPASASLASAVTGSVTPQGRGGRRDTGDGHRAKGPASASLASAAPGAVTRGGS